MVIIPWWMLPIKWMGDAFILGLRLAAGGFIVLCRIVGLVARELVGSRDEMAKRQ